jgi:LPXTG-motif cell wall-anchored protein
MYDVKVKVTYKDALREEHEVILDGRVAYTPLNISSTNNNTQPTSTLITSNTSTVIILGIIGAGAAGFFIGRRSKRSIQV